MKTSTDTTETYSEQFNNSQHLRTLFEAQYCKQAEIREQISNGPLYIHVIKKLIDKEVTVESSDIMHCEALRVNRLVDFILSKDQKEISSQEIASKVFSSSEFELKDINEINGGELLLKYCPKAIDHIYSADIDEAQSEVDHKINTIVKSKTKQRELRNAVVLFTADVIDTAIITNDEEMMIKLIADNELRHIGYFEGAARFPQEIIQTDSVQSKLLETFINCASFGYISSLKKEAEIILQNNLLPANLVIQIISEAEQNKMPSNAFTQARTTYIRTPSLQSA